MADNNLQASFRKLMRYAQNLAEYEQGIAEGIIDENVFVIVLDEKVAKFKDQTFDWSGGISQSTADERYIRKTVDEFDSPLTFAVADGILGTDDEYYFLPEKAPSTASDSQILATKADIPEIDTSALATKDELIEVEEVAAAAFNDLKGIIDNIPSVEVDAELSADSENAIQNKTVTNELNTKVDKVEGKQLSTEDFTTPLKEKLEGLSAFDPTEINNAIEGLQNSFDALVSGNTSAAIESFNEFVAFLSGITDTQTLAGIVASLEQMIAAKQDKINDLDTIRSGAAKGATAIQKVKTINGEEIVGEGNIEINVDTSTLATKEELTNLQNEVIANEEVVAAAFNDVNERLNAISENVSGTTVTKEEFESAVSEINESIASKADKTYVDEELAKKADQTYVDEKIGNIDFSTLATKEEVQNLTNEMIANEEVHAAAYNDLNERINNIGGGSAGGSGALRVWADNLFGLESTKEHIAENIATFNILLSGEHASVLVCAEVEESIPEAEYVGKQTMTIPVRTVVVDVKSTDINIQEVVLYFGENDTDGVALNPDGSVEIIAEENPAPSGPLRVWMNTLGGSENTPEQTTENIATYNALKKELNAIVFAVAKISVGIEGAPDIAVSYLVSQKQDTGESGIYMIIRDVIEGELMEMSFSLLPNGTILQ